MGGDFAPRVAVEAAARFSLQKRAQILLVGERPRLEASLRDLSHDPRFLHVHHAPAGANADVRPASILRRPRGQALFVAVELLREGAADALVSAGHSGVLMALCKRRLGAIPGIRRPAIATPLPARRGRCLLLDSGANVDCRPTDLLDFARLGQLYLRLGWGVERPQVALLSNAQEPGRGNALVRAAFPLLQEGLDDFVGNLETRELHRGRADVFVCDGFVGNLVLKAIEASGAYVELLLRDLRRPWRDRVGSWLMRRALRTLAERVHPREIGGSLLVGLNKPVVVAHGASGPGALYHALELALRIAQAGLAPALAQSFAHDARTQRTTPVKSSVKNPARASSETASTRKQAVGLTKRTLRNHIL